MNPVVEEVAKRLYENGAPSDQRAWADLPEENKAGWLSDAQIATVIVSQEAARLADMCDPDKPTNWMFRREQIAPVLRGIPNNPPNTY